MKKLVLTFSLFSFLFLFGLPSTYSQQDLTQIREMLRESRQLLDNTIEEIAQLKVERRNLNEWIKLLNQKYQNTLKAFNLLREGRRYEAAIELSKNHALDPSDAATLEFLALIFSELRIYEEATSAYEKLLDLRPNDEKAYSNLGFIHAEQNKHDLAVEYYLKALSLNPEFPVAHFNLALSYQNMGKRKKALEHFISAGEFFPEDSTWQKMAKEKAMRTASK